MTTDDIKAEATRDAQWADNEGLPDCYVPQSYVGTAHREQYVAAFKAARRQA